MGYTHYAYRPKTMDRERFAAWSANCNKIVDYCREELEIDIDGCGRFGEEPHFSEDYVWFNGSDKQRPGKWTTEENICIPWPSAEASLTPAEESPFATKTAGYWYAGTSLAQRVAPIDDVTGKGLGSYETFAIKRVYDTSGYYSTDDENPELVFEFCKTAYRPYDVAVTACLIALKHHFPECIIASDGEDKDWLDGQFLCQRLFGYGLDFKLRN